MNHISATALLRCLRTVIYNTTVNRPAMNIKSYTLVQKANCKNMGKVNLIVVKCQKKQNKTDLFAQYELEVCYGYQKG